MGYCLESTRPYFGDLPSRKTRGRDGPLEFRLHGGARSREVRRPRRRATRIFQLGTRKDLHNDLLRDYVSTTADIDDKGDGTQKALRRQLSTK